MDLSAVLVKRREPLSGVLVYGEAFRWFSPLHTSYSRQEGKGSSGEMVGTKTRREWCWNDLIIDANQCLVWTSYPELTN